MLPTGSSCGENCFLQGSSFASCTFHSLLHCISSWTYRKRFLHSSVALSSETTLVKKVSSKRSSTGPSCLEAIQCVLQGKDFLGGLQDREMVKIVQMLSCDIYQGKWSIFCSWCRCKNTSLLTATIQQITDFLIYLLRDIVLLLSAVRVTSLPCTRSFLLGDWTSPPPGDWTSPPRRRSPC